MRGRSEGAVKKTPVKTSAGTSTSAAELFIRVTVSVEPSRAKAAEADRFPYDPEYTATTDAGLGAGRVRPSKSTRTVRRTHRPIVGIRLSFCHTVTQGSSG